MKWADERESFWNTNDIDNNNNKKNFVDKSLYVSTPPLSTLMNKLSLDLDSVGELQPQNNLAHAIFRDIKICKNYMKPVVGNRTCFATCK